jgi:hypothetical protein
MDIIIEKNIPAPVELVKKEGRRRYPFDALDVGDSFFVSNEMAGSYDILRNTGYQYSVRARKQYADLTGDTKNLKNRYRLVIKEEPGGFRVWRVS